MKQESSREAKEALGGARRAQEATRRDPKLLKSARWRDGKGYSRPSVRRKGCKIPWAAWTSQTAAFHCPGISPLLSMRFLAATASI